METPSPVGTPPKSTNGDAPGGPLEQIRARRDAIAARKQLTLLVPSYEGLVAVRYQALAKDAIDKMVARIQKANDTGELMAANADLLIRCCVEIVGRRDDDAKWEPVLPDATTTFSTATLAAAFGAEAGSARDEVYALFSPNGQQPMAHAQHAQALSNWMNGQLEKIEKELLGE